MASNCTICQGVGITPVENKKAKITYQSTEDNNQVVNLVQWLKAILKTICIDRVC